MNEYDSNRILDLTKKINYVLTDKIHEANCYVLNTCHIREKATDKVYHDIGRVKKEFRKKGIGKSLIELIISEARLRNSENIILEVRADNVEAQTLYKKLNFQIIGTRKDYYESENGREDAFVLKLDL